MQADYRLNNYPLSEFEKIGFNKSKIYNILYRAAKDINKLEQHLFIEKYGDDEKYEAFENYYYLKFKKISRLKKNERYKDLFWQIKDDFIKSAELFKLSDSKLDVIWENVVSILLWKRDIKTTKPLFQYFI